MTYAKPMRKHVVISTEYERGWGSKQFMAVDYPSKEETMNVVTKTNSKLIGPTPDYYIKDSYVEEISEEYFNIINK